MPESQLGTHDIELPILQGNDETEKRLLRYLLLSPNSIMDTNLAATLLRIQHFVSLTGGADIAIVILLSLASVSTTVKASAQPDKENIDGVYAYAKLEAELFSLVDMPNIPTLPLANISGLVALLKTHAEGLAQHQPEKKPSFGVRTIDFLEQCTIDPPLCPLAVRLTTDNFPSLRALAAEAIALKDAKAATDHGPRLWTSSSSDLGSLADEVQPGFTELRTQLPEEIVQAMVAFWEEEWAVE